MVRAAGTGLVSPALIGRDDELSALVGALHEARQGQPTLVLLSGEAGVGKTRLLEEFLARATAAGCRTLGGACLDISVGDLPFVPLRQVVRTLEREFGIDGLRQLLGDSWPDVGLLLPSAGGPPGSERSGGQARTFDLALHLVDQLARERPLVLAIEDLHWADRSSIDVLTYVIRGLADRPVLLVATYRDEDQPDMVEWRSGFAELARHRHTVRLALTGLSDPQTDALVRALRPDADPDVVRFAQTRSGGIPFLVEEFVAAAAAGRLDQIPSRLADMLRLKLAALPPDAQAIVKCVATLGREVDHHVVVTAAQVPADRVGAAVNAAVNRHVLEWYPPSRYGFRHAYARDVAYGTMLPAERIAMHAAVAAALEPDAQQADSADAVVLGELAFHWLQAGDDDSAYEPCVAAARAATRAYAYPEAVRHYEHALGIIHRRVPTSSAELATEFELLCEAAEAAHWANQTAQAQTYLERALTVATEGNDEAIARRLLLALNNDLWLAMADRRQADAWIDKWGDAATRASVAAGDRMVAGDYAGSAELARDALELARRAGTQTQEVKAGYLLGVDLVMLGDVDRGLAVLEQARELAHQTGDRSLLIAVYVNTCFVLDHEGRIEEGLAAALDGIEVARSLGASSSDGGLLWVNAAHELVKLGRLDEAVVLIDEALEQTPPPGVAAMLTLYGAELATMRGEIEDALAALEALASDLRIQDYQVVGQLAGARAEALLWKGRPAAARRVLDEVLAELSEDDPRLIAHLIWLVVRADADLVAANPTDAELVAAAGQHADATLERAAALASKSVGPGASAETLAYLALAEAEHARLRDPRDATAWQAAGKSWPSNPYLAGYCLLAEGSALGMAGQRKAASERLRDAHRIATDRGFGAIVRAADGLAQAFRVKIAASTPASVDEGDALPSMFHLTAREAEVLRLLADGHSNRVIARRLSTPGRSMSESTASVHVSRILAKLGVASRTEAAALAHRSGFVTNAPASPR
jgi:DNA-binding CsgD family transcriptional regulator/tetratricopeptide (TPR) repeat protein